MTCSFPHPDVLGKPIMSTRVGTSLGSFDVISAAGQIRISWYRTLTALSRSRRVARGVANSVVKSLRIESRKSKYFPFMESSFCSLN